MSDRTFEQELQHIAAARARGAAMQIREGGSAEQRTAYTPNGSERTADGDFRDRARETFEKEQSR